MTNTQHPKSNNPFKRLWGWLEYNVSPKHFYHTFTPWVKPLAFLAATLIAIGSVWGLAFAPMDKVQGDSYRIIYIHVPAAALSMSLYMGLAVMGVLYLVWKVKIAELMARAIAPFGFMLCVISLITGAIWGKPTWGTYWVWDARLTSMLILAFLYAGVIALYAAYQGSNQSGLAGAILSVIGVINLPIIRYSVDWWNSLHQGSTFSITHAPKMDSSMYWPLLLMFIGFYVLAAAVVLYRTNTFILQKDKNSRWVFDVVKSTTLNNSSKQ